MNLVMKYLTCCEQIHASLHYSELKHYTANVQDVQDKIMKCITRTFEKRAQTLDHDMFPYVFFLNSQVMINAIHFVIHLHFLVHVIT